MTIHIFGPRPENTIRIRTWCPGHKHLCYGRFIQYYDTMHLAFDCKTFVDLGYGEWRGLPGPRGGQKRKAIRKRDIPHWQPHMREWMRRTDTFTEHLHRTG